MHSVESPTDQTLREAIERDVARSSEIATPDIHVDACDGIVTLSGFAHSYFEKLAAEEIARSKAGIVGLANDIVVLLGERSDPELARDVQRALYECSGVPSNRIIASVRKGFVTLTGRLGCYAQKRAAEHALDTVRGLKGITNQIEIESENC